MRKKSKEFDRRKKDKAKKNNVRNRSNKKKELNVWKFLSRQKNIGTSKTEIVIEKLLHAHTRREERKEVNYHRPKQTRKHGQFRNYETEVRRQIARLKLKKSPGEHGIRNEDFKYSIENIVVVITEILSGICR